MEIFEISSVAKILDVPSSRIKNWTIGRPFKVKPAIRTARGKGSRNLYSLENLNLLALINQLTNNGLAPWAIERVLELAPKERFLESVLERHPYWIISIDGKKILLDRMNEATAAATLKFGEADLSGKYVLNVHNLLKWVSQRIVREQVGLLRRREK
jgi:DNA-binding transcriptional MerR regulator